MGQKGKLDRHTHGQTGTQEKSGSMDLYTLERSPRCTEQVAGICEQRVGGRLPGTGSLKLLGYMWGSVGVCREQI